jgi:hypothetical protein
MRTLTTSRILGMACLCRMDMKAEPGGRQMAGPMMAARLAAVAAAVAGAMDADVVTWHNCRQTHAGVCVCVVGGESDKARVHLETKPIVAAQSLVTEEECPLV